MPAKLKFTPIPKVRDLMEAGVPAEAIPTYCALTDYANNKTDLCWPKMETLARLLGRSVRTVQSADHSALINDALIDDLQARENQLRAAVTHPWSHEAKEQEAQHLRDEAVYPQGSPRRYNDVTSGFVVDD